MTQKLPAIWGKLPVFGDFVRARVTVEQIEDWQHWFERFPISAQGAPKLQAHALPWSFVLSPGCLPFSGGRYVVGVMADSCDKVGRRHPFVIYQLVSRRWLIGSLNTPRNVLFWLARLLACHAPSAVRMPDNRGGAQSLETGLAQLWKRCQPALFQRLGLARAAPPDLESVGTLITAGGTQGPALELQGVVSPPWAAWPYCLGRTQGAWFWQQDTQGRYVGQHQIAAQALGRRASDSSVMA